MMGNIHFKKLSKNNKRLYICDMDILLQSRNLDLKVFSSLLANKNSSHWLLRI